MKAIIAKLVDGQNLDEAEMMMVMNMIMTGKATDAQIGSFLTALRIKGETVTEIFVAANVMRELSTKVNVIKQPCVDIVGTGGDLSGTFNVSTVTAIIVAAAGCVVAKHGNRSVSSRSGSADVLELAGYNLDLTAEQVGNCVNQIGVGFLFAPTFHGAMKYAINPRKELGIRTIFNLLGPLTNPANATHQLIGVFAKKWLVPFAEVLQRLGSEHALIVHGDDGLDEISHAAHTHVAELRDGEIVEFGIVPEEFGIERGSVAAIKVVDAGESLALIQKVLDGEHCAARDIVLLNAGAAIYVAGLADSIQDGVVRAQGVIDNGAAKAKWQALIEFG